MKSTAGRHSLLFSVCLLFASHANSQATEKEKEKADQTTAFNVEAQETLLEQLTVWGQFIGLESPGVEGSHTLDQAFIQFTPKTTGDINELVALLPGVQASEEAVEIDSLMEISALPVAISGGQPWQTGFFLDGLNYNNAVDPTRSVRTTSSANDVTGGVQTMNINSQLIASIEVFDNNIPAEHGDFSGGVVKSRSKNAFQFRDTVVQFGYRSNQGNWGEYHIITPDGADGAQSILDFDATTPEFTKRNIDFLLATKVNKHHGFITSLNLVDSKSSDISLGQQKQESRENLNGLIKYSYREGWIDALDVSLLHAPYQTNEYLKDVLSSDFTLEGGSSAVMLNLDHGFEGFTLFSSLNLSVSDNTRTAPAHYYEWQRAKGRDWSAEITGLDVGEEALFTAREGGYGNLENTQTTYSWQTGLHLDSVNWLGANHSIRIGTKIQNRIVERKRVQEHYRYEQARIYATGLNGNPLNCSGYQFDCVEQQLSQSIESLTEQLGGSIDFSNPDHIIAYSDNILVTPQYFYLRTVNPVENIRENLFKMSVYATDSMDWENLQLNLGLRYEYDDFYDNHNIAPRISGGYDLFGSGNSQLILGVNRYYSAGQVGNKIREQQQQAYNQFRPISQGALQGWLDFSVNGDFRYRYTNLATPYDDEAVVGWKQSSQTLGQFSLKWVRRWKRDQLARNPDAPLQSDGYKYITYNNGGTGSSNRYSFAWNGYFSGHSIWLNASYSENIISGQSANDIILDTPLEELVFYGDEIVSRDTLSNIRSNFGRPVTINGGWNYDWTDSLSTGLTLRYLGAYDTAEQLPYRKSTGDILLDCSGCESVFITLPAYEKVRKDARVTVALNTTWNWQVAAKQTLRLRADISNLFNSRTHTINEELGEIGIEVGRQFWLGVHYFYE